MNLNEIKAGNNVLLVDPIYTKPKKESGIIDPRTLLEMGGKSSYYDHPLRALVIIAPEFFYFGDAKYKSDIKAGDVILLNYPVEPKPDNMVVIEGITYFMIHFSEAKFHYRPSEEEREKMKFFREMDEKQVN